MSVIEAAPAFVLLVLSLFSAVATINAVRPYRHILLLLPSMFWSWLVLGLLGHLLIAQVVLAAALVALGALDYGVGLVALAILVTSWAGMVYALLRTRAAKRVVDEALGDAGVTRTAARVARWRTLLAFPIRGRSVVKVKNVPFRRVAGRTLKLDISHRRSEETNRPVFVYIHGGAWIMGSRREQGLPIIHHLARNGWLCFSLSYRLSPGAGWPDHLVDVKAGLAWVREHASEYGGDASFLVVSGGSAGGHLAAMAGLTENQPQYQPGFEDADTSVKVAVPIYGIYDMTNRLGRQSKQFLPQLVEPLVVKAYLEDEPEKFFDASPIDRVHPDVPPFVVPHGDLDTLSPVDEARAFVEQLRAASSSRVVYMEFPGAQHIFDIGYSYQSAQMIEGILSVLEDEYARTLEARESEGSGRF
ncbi:MAG: alpha/beta hydrolase [Acidimicrobiia bacterium]|nr:alpha/beta hydrolase [Acidimicrobiia bacterium]